MWICQCSYLKEEWRGRVPETSQDICSRFDNVRFILLELNVDWFPFADATLKRVVIQRLVYDLLEAPSHKSPPVRSNDDNIH
ncbi:hypothetical protein Tco_1453568 [Tanacetum coccineum]